MNERDCHGALADGRRDSLDGVCSHVACGKDPGNRRLQEVRFPGQPPSVPSLGCQAHARDDETARITFHPVLSAQSVLGGPPMRMNRWVVATCTSLPSRSASSVRTTDPVIATDAELQLEPLDRPHVVVPAVEHGIPQFVILR